MFSIYNIAFLIGRVIVGGRHHRTLRWQADD